MKNNKIILGILIFLIILPLTNAVSYPYTETIDTKSYIYSSNINYLSGSLILTKDNTNLSIKNISTKYDVNATIAYVLNSSKNIICSWVISSQTKCDILNNSYYYVVVGSNGSNYTEKYSNYSSAGWPVNRILMSWESDVNIHSFNSNYSIGALMNLSASGTSYVESVYSITFMNYSWSINSNISLLNNQNNINNFDILINVSGAFEPTKTCGIISNNSDFVCVNQTFTGNSTVTSCNGVLNFTGTVSFLPWCNDSTIIKYNETESVIYFDTSIPIFIHYFLNKTHFILTNITGSFNFSDQNLFRWNVSLDGITVDSDFNVSYTNYNYNFSKDPSSLSAGYHTLLVEVADGHTSNTIKNYDVDNGIFFSDDLSFDTGDNKISIEAVDKSIFDIFDYEKSGDRYKFSYTPNPEGLKELVKIGEKNYIKKSFLVDTNTKIFVVHNKDSAYKTWLVSGNNWVDFYNNSILNELTTIIVDENDETNAVVNIYYPSNLDSISFNSVGDLNIVNVTYQFYSANISFINQQDSNQGETITHSTIIDFTGTLYNYNNFSANFNYFGSNKTIIKSNDLNFVYFNTTFIVPNVNTTQNTTFYWNISINNNINKLFYGNQTIHNSGLFLNCSIPNSSVTLNLCGKDEVTLNNISDMSLKADFDILENGVISNIHYGFIMSNSTCYEICINPSNSSLTVNGKFEYGTNEYTDRKYYINNVNLSKVSTNITFFHLPLNISSDVILTVFNKNNGDRLKDVFIKILRYYPGTNDSNSLYQLVEVEKTDQNGETLGKFVLADVWYKFIIEYPVGTVVFNSDIQKIISINKLLPISISQGNLLTYKKLLDLNGDVSCDYTTNTCRFTWSNPSNTEVTGTLKVYQDTGFSKILVYEESAVSPAATIAYVIPNITNKRFVAQGWINP